MCGIAGAFGTGAGRDAAVIDGVRRMTRAQTHRGPDDEGWLQRDDAVFGHNRLSIVDLSSCGRQPMPNEDRTVWVAFNGEIYNHRVLRGELERLGHHFVSTSDTEVLVHGYESWGIDRLLDRLRGMFAFALYDGRPTAEGRAAPDGDAGGVLFLARDRCGIKPLYYAARRERLVFASEVRALRRSGLVPTEEDPRARAGFLVFGSVPTPWTTMRAAQSLPPGHYLAATADGVRLTRYYALESLFSDGADDADGGRDSAARVEFGHRLRAALDEAVALHLISDAPLGVFLSGGIDSSALVALAAARRQELRTVGIVFEESQFSEEPYQQVVARRYRTDHYRVLVTAKDFRDELPRFAAAIDQPTVDGVNTYFVAAAARRAGLKAVLAGVGGDEVFAGYATLRRAPALRRLQGAPAPVRRAAAAIAGHYPSLRRLALLRRRGALPLYLAQRALYTPAEAARLLGTDERDVWAMLEPLEPARAPRHPVLIQQLLEARHYLADQLLKDADVFGMAHSLEIRVPFLDHVLAETVLRTPLAWRLDRRWPKPLLSRTLADLLPNEVVFRRKQGFVFPMAAWLRSWDAANAEAGELDRRAYAATWREFREGRVHWSRPWTLFVLSRTAQAA